MSRPHRLRCSRCRHTYTGTVRSEPAVCPQCFKRAVVSVGVGSCSSVADKWLTGLRGLEVGGSGHNCFHLDTINVDHSRTEAHRLDLIHYDFEPNIVAPIDVLADACALPFRQRVFEFVVASHVLEHIWDPLAALREWGRVASRLCIVVPVPWLCDEADDPRTTLEELLTRPTRPRPTGIPYSQHVCCWEPDAFVHLFEYLGMRVLEVQSPDDKAGNGTLVVADVA